VNRTNSAVPALHRGVGDAPHHVFHASFEEMDAEALYAGDATVEETEQFNVQHMPDEATRAYARRMHYAAYRCGRAAAPRDAARWKQRYLTLRDLVVLGNRKLVFRAVRRWTALTNHSEDLVGDCYIVLIRAVAVYNPWMGVRFSTYAYTCLVRALSRLSQRSAADLLSRSLPLESLADAPPDVVAPDEPPSERLQRLDEFLREDHPLLSEREKFVIARRFCLSEQSEGQTLEKVGRDIGLSKERVRQVQATALSKLRKALDESDARTGQRTEAPVGV
jgi:RNA polymerase primary sigma factor/RNA polymerase sigma factor